MKSDINGNPLWMRAFVYDKKTGLNGISIVETKNGEYIVAGNTYSSTDLVNKMALLKVNKNGDYQWTKIFKDEKYKSAELKYLIPSTEDNSVVIAGTGYNNNKNGSIILGKVKID